MSGHCSKEFENVPKPDFINLSPSLSLDLQNHVYNKRNLAVVFFDSFCHWIDSLSVFFFYTLLDHVWKHIISFIIASCMPRKCISLSPFPATAHDRQSTKNILSKQIFSQVKYRTSLSIFWNLISICMALYG